MSTPITSRKRSSFECCRQPYSVVYDPIPTIAAVTAPRTIEITIITIAETTMYGIALSGGVPMTGARPR